MNIICAIVVIFKICFVVVTPGNGFPANDVRTVTDAKKFLLLPKINRYIVHLHVRNEANGKIKSCLGSLIKEEWILTAAHCVANRKPNSITAHFGAIQLRLITRIEKILIHPSYEASLFIHDIALLRIRKTFRFIEPIPSIFNLTSSERNYFNNIVTQFRSDYTPMLFKWQENATSVQTNPLLIITHEIATGKFCQRNIYESICTQTAYKGLDMAKGDSGTAVIGLFHLQPENKYVYFQIGVLSYLKTITHFKRHKDEKGQIHDIILRQDIGYVSNNLFYYMEWIESVIGKRGLKLVQQPLLSTAKPLMPVMLPISLINKNEDPEDIMIR